jgi:hypothetical protein
MAATISLLPFVSIAQEATGLGSWTAYGQTATGSQSISVDPVDIDILSCPTEVFQDSYRDSLKTADVLATAALEIEAIKVCNLRQKVAEESIKNTLAMYELIEELKQKSQPSTATRNEDGTQDEPRTANRAITETATQEDPQATPEKGTNLAGTIADLVSSVTGSGDIGKTAARQSEEPIEGQQTAQSEDPVTPAKAVSQGCAPEYLVKNAGHQLHGDGKNHWATLAGPFGEEFVVRGGDMLPGGVKVKSVNPEVVLVTHPAGKTKQLAVAPREPVHVMEPKFTYTLTSPDQMNSGSSPAPILPSNSGGVSQ